MQLLSTRIQSVHDASNDKSYAAKKQFFLLFQHFTRALSSVVFSE